MLIISLIGWIVGLIALVNEQTLENTILTIICICLCLFWSVKAATYNKVTKKPIVVKTIDKPQIDTIVTNRTDTLFIYHFNSPLK